VSLRSRLTRLERERSDGGRCSVCQGRPDYVVISARQDSSDDAPVRIREHEDMGEPCNGCGWAPDVTEVIELVVGDRADVAGLRERGEWKVE
jgi:hypothetical protein